MRTERREKEETMKPFGRFDVDGFRAGRLACVRRSGRSLRFERDTHYEASVRRQPSNLLLLLAALAGLVGTACQSGGVGDPCVPEDEYVTTFNGYGMGSYVVFINTTATLYDAAAFQAPDTPGVQFQNVVGIWIQGSGGDNSLINGVGGPVTSTSPGNQNPQHVTSYP